MYQTNMFYHTVAIYFSFPLTHSINSMGHNQSTNYLIIRKNTERNIFFADRKIYRIFRSHSMDLIRSLDTVMKRSWRHTKCDLVLTRPFARDVLEFRNLLAYNPSCPREGQFLNFMGILPLYLVTNTRNQCSLTNLILRPVCLSKGFTCLLTYFSRWINII